MFRTYGKEFSFVVDKKESFLEPFGASTNDGKEFSLGIHKFIGIFHTVVIILNFLSINVNGPSVKPGMAEL